jgi:hypothetical protein
MYPATSAEVAVMAPHTNDAIPIADCSRIEGFISMEEMAANAALVCAAPEMYYALKALLAGKSYGLGMARDALAKADQTSATPVEG